MCTRWRKYPRAATCPLPPAAYTDLRDPTPRNERESGVCLWGGEAEREREGGREERRKGRERRRRTVARLLRIGEAPHLAVAILAVRQPSCSTSGNERKAREDDIERGEKKEGRGKRGREERGENMRSTDRRTEVGREDERRNRGDRRRQI